MFAYNSVQTPFCKVANKSLQQFLFYGNQTILNQNIKNENNMHNMSLGPNFSSMHNRT